MIKTGAQIRAARAMLGLRREDLARAASLHPNAVQYWEKKRDVPAGPPPYAVERVEDALKAMGVETFADPSPGVRLVA
jgi:transcriptional regulator with XRE-family HTH domain